MRRLALVLTLAAQTGCGRSDGVLDLEAFPVGWYLVVPENRFEAIEPARLRKDKTGWNKRDSGGCAADNDGTVVRFGWTLIDDDRFSVEAPPLEGVNNPEPRITVYARTDDCNRFDPEPIPEGARPGPLFSPIVRGEACYELLDTGRCNITVCPGSQPDC